MTELPQNDNNTTENNQDISTNEVSQNTEAVSELDTNTMQTTNTAKSNQDELLAEEIAKRKARAQRFGISSQEDSAKKILRAEKIGPSADKSMIENHENKTNVQTLTNLSAATTITPAPASMPPSLPSILDDPVEAEKARKRAERFGTVKEDNAKKIKTSEM